jgi:hypothetical protein
LVGWQEKKVLSKVSDSSFFENSDDNDEARRSWRNSAFQEFSRDLGPRVSKRKTQDLLGSFLDQQEGSRESLEGIFSSFPGSAKEKAFNLLDKYKTGFETPPLNPWDKAAENSVFKVPDFASPFLDSTNDKSLLKWLGINDPQVNLRVTTDTAFENNPSGLSGTQPFRTGGQKIDVLQNESLENPGPFYKELDKIGATTKEKQHLQDYIFNENVRTKSGNFKEPVSNSVDSLSQKAAETGSWASFPEKEYPLFRGENIKEGENIPGIGDTYSKNRPTSFATALSSTDQFMGGLTRPDKQVPGQKVLYAVTEYSDAAKPKLLIPGHETEVIAPSSAKFEVTGRGRLQQNPGFYDPATDIELVKLKQLYALDPVTAGIQGAGEMLRSAPRGIAGGAALSALSPEVAQSVAQGQYGKAATQTAQSVVGGALADLGIQAAGQGLQRVAPQLASKVIPAFSGAANVAVPAAVGAGLFMQGKQGSPLNTIVNAASNTPFGLKVNPKTDVGRMAGRAIGNEAQYAWNQIRQGKMPWMGR